MAIVLSLTHNQQSWLEAQLSETEATYGKEIYAKLIRPVKAKQSAALLDAIVDSSIGTAAFIGSDSSGGSGASIAEDGSLKAPEPEWDDTSYTGGEGTGSKILQPGTPAVDLGVDDNQHPDGFSGEPSPSPEFTD